MIPDMRQLLLTFLITLAVFGVCVPGIEAQDRNPANPGVALPKLAPIRCDPTERLRRLQAAGGHPQVDLAVGRGLQWLKKTQAADGSWGAKDKRPDGSSMSNDKNSMTAMALLCFLGHCELQGSEEYGKTVSKAIEFLTSTPPEDRNIGVGNRGAYSHPIRTYALCEAYTMTKIKELGPFAKKAAEAIVKGQNESGGWAYAYAKGPAAHVDLSVTGWNIQALKAASLAGLKIDGLDKAMDKAAAYVKRCQDKTGRFAYKEGSTGKASLTGAGAFSLQIWKDARSEEVQKSLDWIIQNQAKKWSKVNVYEWYYHTKACFQAAWSPGGRTYWDAWNKGFQNIVVSAQDPDGHWPHGAYFHGDTDVFRTTMTILMLEVYYRYAPMGGGRAD